MTELRDKPGFSERWWMFALLSGLILVPCFWHSRIHAGDLSSHAYNAWLALLTEQGKAPGLYLASPWTNVLIDVLLAETMRWFGPDWAQRLTVSFCVLVLFWGAFAWVRAWVGRAVWKVVPVIAMVAYGWVFHVGFFNFYLGLGLGLWACALMRHPSAARCAGAVALLIPAVYAHALAAGATLALLLWQLLNGRLGARWRRVVLALTIALLAGVKWTFGGSGKGASDLGATTLFGADQLDHLGVATTFVAIAVAFLFGWLLVNSAMKEGVAALLSSREFELFAVLQAAAWLLPHDIQLDQYAVPLSFIKARFSILTLLGAGLLMATLIRGRWPVAALAAVCLCQFSVMYVETGWLNQVESGLSKAMESVPVGARAVSTAKARGSRTDQFTHMIDRACIGRCYSYANYELRSTQFRLRAGSHSPVTMGNRSEIWDAELGRYVILGDDLPLWIVRPLDASGRFMARPARVGDIVVRDELSPRLNTLLLRIGR